MKNYESFLTGIINYSIALSLFGALVMLLRLIVFNVELNSFTAIALESFILLLVFFLALKLFQISLKKNIKFSMILLGLLFLLYLFKLWLNSLLSVKIEASFSQTKTMIQAMELSSLQGIFELILGVVLILFLTFKAIIDNRKTNKIV